MWTIYALVDPRTSQIRYIGQTQNHPEMRLDGHLHKVDENKAKQAWFEELRYLRMKPIIVVLEYAPDLEEALEVERDWIRRGRRIGWHLLNLAVSKRRQRQTDQRERKPWLRAHSIPEKTPDTFNAGKWYEYILAYMGRPEGAGLWKQPAQGVRELARAMSVLETGNEANEDNYVSIVSKAAKQIRNSARLPNGDRLGTDITGGAA